MGLLLAIALGLLSCSSLAACSDSELAIIESEIEPNVGSCEEFCGEQNYSCSNLCEFEDFPGFHVSAGQAAYFRGDTFQYAPLKECTTNIPATNASGADLGWIQCCCEVPARNRIDDPNLQIPSTCTDICAAEGLQCEEETHWRNPTPNSREFLGAGGSLWVISSPSFRSTNVEDCDTIRLADASQGETYELHQCGCR